MILEEIQKIFIILQKIWVLLGKRLENTGRKYFLKAFKNNIRNIFKKL